MPNLKHNFLSLIISHQCVLIFKYRRIADERRLSPATKKQSSHRFHTVTDLGASITKLSAVAVQTMRKMTASGVDEADEIDEDLDIQLRGVLLRHNSRMTTPSVAPSDRFAKPLVRKSKKPDIATGFATPSKFLLEGCLTAHLSEHTGAITKIDAPPGSAFFITGSADGSIRLWDSPVRDHFSIQASKQQITNLNGSVTAVAFCRRQTGINFAEDSKMICFMIY